MHIESSDKIDLITFDERYGEYALIICTDGAWDDSEQERDLLLKKINAYCVFVAEGQFLEQFPQASGKPIRIQVDSAKPIPVGIGELITQAQEVLAERGFTLCVNLV